MFLKISHSRWDNLKSFDDLQIVFRQWCAVIAEAAGYKTFLNPIHDPVVPVIELDWEIVGERESLGFWTYYEGEEIDPLIVLLAHSDTEGVILPSDAARIADRLDDIIPNLPLSFEEIDVIGTTTRFVNGLRLAVDSQQPLLFTIY